MSVDPVESLRLAEEEARQEMMACYRDTGAEQAQRFYQRRVHDLFMLYTRQPTLTTDYKAKYEELRDKMMKWFDKYEALADKYTAHIDELSDLRQWKAGMLEDMRNR